MIGKTTAGEAIGHWYSNHSKGMLFDRGNPLSPFYKPKLVNGKINYYDVNATEYAQQQQQMRGEMYDNTLKQQAEDISDYINKNRISVQVNDKVQYHFDLRATRLSGQFHRGIEVPHVTRSLPNVDPQGFVHFSPDNTWVRSATPSDLKFIRNVLKLK